MCVDLALKSQEERKLCFLRTHSQDMIAQSDIQ